MLRSRLAIFVIVALVAAVLTSVYVHQPFEDERRALDVLIMPGIIGYMLVGGVHGGASVTTLKVATCVANGFFWGLGVSLIVAVASDVRAHSAARRLK
jgi:hypothetical protein